MSGKKIAIIYKSLTGNTRQVAEAIRMQLGGEEIVYFGEPKPGHCGGSLFCRILDGQGKL